MYWCQLALLVEKAQREVVGGIQEVVVALILPLHYFLTLRQLTYNNKLFTSDV